MRKLIVFENVSVDGYFVDRDGGMDWAHAGGDDAEFRSFVEGNASSDGILVFGRITYEMMAGFWPTPAAQEMMPLVAERMNRGHKIVFSRKMKKAEWSNTELLAGSPVDEIRRLKASSGKDLVILGSGSLVAQLAQAGLVDEFQFVVSPVALGGGRTLFEGAEDPVHFTLAGSRAFANGKVFVRYHPA